MLCRKPQLDALILRLLQLLLAGFHISFPLIIYYVKDPQEVERAHFFDPEPSLSLSLFGLIICV